MKHWIVAILAVLGLGSGLRAQAPAAPPAQVMDTTVCDVVKKPATFDGKIVRIKGTVIVGFDQFAIKDATDPNCGFPVNTIWLEYPAGTKGKAGAAAIVEIQPAKNFSGQYTAPTRTAVTLDKSKDFKQFDSLLSQAHQKGSMCLGCARYEVTATLIGRLDTVDDPALKRDASGKIVGFGGFGNMNSYPARLVLQSVGDVTPKEIDYSKSDAETKTDVMQAAGGGSDLSSATAAMQKVAGNLGAGPLKDLAVKALNEYGKPGQGNGVVVGFGKTNELSPKDEGMGAQDSPNGVLFNCTFNEDRLQGDALSRAIVHMGVHISELRDPEKGNEDAPVFVLESDGWVVTTVTSLTLGQKFLTLPGGYVVWDTSWPGEQRNDKMEAVLKDFLGNEMLISR
jgi:hypothetical protein